MTKKVLILNEPKATGDMITNLLLSEYEKVEVLQSSADKILDDLTSGRYVPDLIIYGKAAAEKKLILPDKTDTPLLLLTESQESQNIAELTSGFNFLGYLTKPFEASQIDEKIQPLISKAASQPATEMPEFKAIDDEIVGLFAQSPSGVTRNEDDVDDVIDEIENTIDPVKQYQKTEHFVNDESSQTEKPQQSLIDLIGKDEFETQDADTISNPENTSNQADYSMVYLPETDESEQQIKNEKTLDMFDQISSNIVPEDKNEDAATKEIKTSDDKNDETTKAGLMLDDSTSQKDETHQTTEHGKEDTNQTLSEVEKSPLNITDELKTNELESHEVQNSEDINFSTYKKNDAADDISAFEKDPKSEEEKDGDDDLIPIFDEATFGEEKTLKSTFDEDLDLSASDDAQQKAFEKASDNDIDTLKDQIKNDDFLDNKSRDVLSDTNTKQDMGEKAHSSLEDEMFAHLDSTIEDTSKTENSITTESLTDEKIPDADENIKDEKIPNIDESIKEVDDTIRQNFNEQSTAIKHQLDGISEEEKDLTQNKIEDTSKTENSITTESLIDEKIPNIDESINEADDTIRQNFNEQSTTIKHQLDGISEEERDLTQNKQEQEERENMSDAMEEEFIRLKNSPPEDYSVEEFDPEGIKFNNSPISLTNNIDESGETESTSKPSEEESTKTLLGNEDESINRKEEATNGYQTGNNAFDNEKSDDQTNNKLNKKVLSKQDITSIVKSSLGQSYHGEDLTSKIKALEEHIKFSENQNKLAKDLLDNIKNTIKNQ